MVIPWAISINAKLRSAEILLEESGQTRLIRRAENQRITLQHCMALTLKNRAFWYNRKCVNIEFRRKTLMSTFFDNFIDYPCFLWWNVGWYVPTSQAV